ncbi:hypothetical protein [Umezawaea sp. Da 62-37]|uniref:hypothetical protein n=1 Tax=Umezawaea sp. Da 62-37 TaxID=3075927 RepID=UPI0028F6D06B|nr:hypothetical protein [Umezawaea sp. Da 62-37]WNV82989.1 hypothetical protein RM788_33000 [Umezawaea sp. Da 62-37]
MSVALRDCSRGANQQQQYDDGYRNPVSDHCRQSAVSSSIDRTRATLTIATAPPR